MSEKKQASSGYVPVKTRILAGLAAGLYPFLHYYTNNFNLADSWPQFLFLTSLCLVAPVVIAIALPVLFRIRPVRRWSKYSLSVFNFVYFTGLLGLLIFHFRKVTFLLILAGVGLLGLVLYRYLSKIVILQYLLAIMSFVTLVPRLLFVSNYNYDWPALTETLDEVKLKSTPNIYFIQPDGYANFSALREPPYNHLDRGFEYWLNAKGFVHYDDFRSNYFTTLSSNSAVFAMKHHYYEIIHKSTAKTYNTQEVIVGDNVTLRLLKNNGYKNHLFTDNTFFLLNRKMRGFDYCNIPRSSLSYYKVGPRKDIDMVADFRKVMADQDDSPNFYFIEKTVPGHIENSKHNTRGKEVEREKYLESLEVANQWLQDIINTIFQHDEDPLIFIMADHGGYVGLDYLSELDERKLNELETHSVYTAIMSVRYPGDSIPADLTMRSGVNVFRNLFFHLSKDSLLLKSYQPDSSIIYTMENDFVEVYKCIDENGVYGYKKIPQGVEE